MKRIDADELLEHLYACLQNARQNSAFYDLREIIEYIEKMQTEELEQNSSMSRASDWEEMLVRCDNCGHMIHVKREGAGIPLVQPEPSQMAREIATIIENEKDMRVVEKNAKQGWVTVKDRMPESDGLYLVWALRAELTNLRMKIRMHF